MVDTSFDFRTDSYGRDPDSASATLKQFHIELWSKPLPGGMSLRLEDAGPEYLRAKHDGRLLRVTSDTISNSLAGHKRIASLMPRISKNLVQEVKDLGSTVGSRVVFPGDKVKNKPSINVSRGFHPRIKDRFDLTLECIRRHYQSEASPLENVLSRHHAFFSLFENFEGYVGFFLLDDLLAKGGVKFFVDAENCFAVSPYPASVFEYETYLNRTLDFLAARNERIDRVFSSDS